MTDSNTTDPRSSEASKPSVPQILVVDDDVELCELLTLRLEGAGYGVATAHDVRAALGRFDRERFDAIVLDLRLGEESGFVVLEGILKRAPDVPVIMLTAHGTIDVAVEAMRRGAFGFITKPYHDHDLLQKIAHAVEGYRLRREVAGLRRIVGWGTEARLLGVSDAIEEVRQRVARVGPGGATTLVTGESGSGKELVARCIHAASPRAREPFVAVKCTGLTAEVLARTLFGHARHERQGPDAVERDGVIAAARRGTLFVDEIGEMPLELQGKLVRLLDERTFTKVGGTNEEPADVRVIVATNRDLLTEVSEKRFREDLYYRLAVVPVVVPPLRERREDVGMLAQIFLERAAARTETSCPRISARALSALVEHPWPGNVRELANVMEAALVAARDGEIDVEHLPGVASLSSSEAGPVADDFARAVRRWLSPYASTEAAALPPLREARDAFERMCLEVVLRRSSGNVAAAAKMAARNRTDFYDLLHRHRLAPADFKPDAKKVEA